MRPWFMATNAAATTFPLRSVDSTMKKAVAAILFRSHGFRSVTADDVRTLAAITPMKISLKQSERVALTSLCGPNVPAA